MKVAEGGKDRRRIQRMFAGISKSYDLLNHLLSLNVDRLWRRAAVRLLDPRPGERILDVCTGTADLALEVARLLERRDRAGALSTPPAPASSRPSLVVGADFCAEMVHLGEEKRRRRPHAAVPVALGVSDALRLAFPDRAFDAVAVAFGIRNVCDLDAALREMLRVLRPGGRAVILEFTTPPGAFFRALFGVYFHRVLPRIGRWVARARDPLAQEAYSYLPASVGDFPGPQALSRVMAGAGFRSVRYRLLSLGIAAVHIGERPPLPPAP